jgi:peptide/nickel transport system ATP-binding protein
MSGVLEVRNLSVDLPLPAGMLHAVQGVSFTVGRGETFSIVGESGCGKSITALAVMNLLPRGAIRRAGALLFEGKDLMELDEKAMGRVRGARITMIFQEPMTSLDPCYTIGNQLEEVFLEHRPNNRREARDRAVYLLEKVGITAASSRLSQYPHQLSGGLRQRIMIAMALMCSPALIIADEPTTALDVTIQAQILALLASLQKEFHMGLLLITHDLGVVARVSDRLAVMYCGRIVETGSVKEVFEKPLHPYTLGLLNCIPVPGRTLPGEELGSIPGLVPTPIGDFTGCSFRNRCPEAIPSCTRCDMELVDVSVGHSHSCAVRRNEQRKEFRNG